MLDGYRNARLQPVGRQQLIKRFGDSLSVYLVQLLIAISAESIARLVGHTGRQIPGACGCLPEDAPRCWWGWTGRSPAPKTEANQEGLLAFRLEKVTSL